MGGLGNCLENGGGWFREWFREWRRMVEVRIVSRIKGGLIEMNIFVVE